jgi:hypothetical protein
MNHKLRGSVSVRVGRPWSKWPQLERNTCIFERVAQTLDSRSPRKRFQPPGVLRGCLLVCSGDNRLLRACFGFHAVSPEPPHAAAVRV